MIAEKFHEFSPEGICLFKRADELVRPLVVGDLLNIRIRMSGHCQVRVLHLDANSITLATLPGHPEAGRITFGAYRNEHGDVIFHIRSRARSSSAPLYAGFLALGEAMQTNTWTEFVNRVALSAGDGTLSVVHAETRKITDEDDPESGREGPTFLARGD